MIISQTVKPASSAMRMKSQCAQRERWLFHMTNAVEANTPEGEVRDALLRYFEGASEQMVNTPGE